MDLAVIDSSLLVEMLIAPDFAERVARVIGEPELRAPDLLNVEVVSTLRRLERTGALSAHRSAQLVGVLESAPIDRLPTLPLMAAAWDLRANITAYDAVYVALAAADECPLLTCDQRLARAPNLPAEVIDFPLENQLRQLDEDR